MKLTREEQAERSIFVGNLQKTTSELELMEHFNKFGSLSRVIIDKEKSAYAIIEFAAKQSAVKATEEEKQIMNGLHIVVRPREMREFVSSGIKQRNDALEDKKKKEESQRLETQVLIAKLSQKETTEDQMATLCESVSLSPSSLQIRYLICHLLQEVFSEFFANCRVFPYGSSVNGCGGDSSDLDIFLSLNWTDESWKYQFASLKQPEQTPGSSSQDAGGSSDEVKDANRSFSSDDGQMDEESLDPDQAPEKESLEFVAQIIQKCVPSCRKVQTIASARKPVVKFAHKESGLHCDIVLNNRLSLRNTELIHFYTTLHPVVRSSILFVRRWAKLNHIAENTGPGPRLTNYALTWMVVVFLQTKGIVPTVEELKRNAEPEEQLTIDGWDCSLHLDGTQYHKKQETVESGEVLQAFFDYYSDVDWRVNCISPVKGQILPIDKMKEVAHSSSDERFKSGPLNIQDPLELTHNTTSNVNEKTIKILSQEVKKAALTCKSLNFWKPKSDVVDGDASPLWGISMLLSLQPQESTRKKGIEKGGNYCLKFVMKDEYLTKEFVKKHGDLGRCKVFWAERVRCVLLGVLMDTLKVSCVKVGDEIHGTSSKADSKEIAETAMDVDGEDPEGEGPPEKRQRTIEPSNETMEANSESEGSTADTPLMYSCSLKHDIWVGRRKMRRNLQKLGTTTSTGLALEKLVTEKLIQEATDGQDKDELITEFHVEILRDDASVKLAMMPLKGETAFKLFYHFLESFLTKVVDEMEF